MNNNTKAIALKKEILSLLFQKMSIKEIAQILGISEWEVILHIKKGKGNG